MTKILPHKDKKVQINFINFIGCVITWILALFCTFVFVQYTFVNVLGIKKDAKKDENPPVKSNKGQNAEPEGYR